MLEMTDLCASHGDHVGCDRKADMIEDHPSSDPVGLKVYVYDVVAKAYIRVLCLQSGEIESPLYGLLKQVPLTPALEKAYEDSYTDENVAAEFLEQAND